MLGIATGLMRPALYRTSDPQIPVLTLTSGSGYQGSVLTSSKAGQWSSAGAPLSGQTGTSLTITPALEGEVIRCANSAPWQIWTPKAATPLIHLRPDKTDSLTISDGFVSAIADSAGSYDLLQTTAASQPKTGRMINTISALEFDGDDSLTISAITSPLTGAGDSLMAMVLSPDNASGTSYLLGSIVGTWRMGLAIVAGQFRYFHHNNLTGPSTPLVTGPQILLGYRQGGATVLRLNGSQKGTSTSGTAPPSSAIAFGHGFSGAIGESVIWMRYSDSTRDQIEGYLAHKYGLAASLPADHPYKSAAPRIS